MDIKRYNICEDRHTDNNLRESKKGDVVLYEDIARFIEGVKCTKNGLNVLQVFYCGHCSGYLGVEQKNFCQHCGTKIRR